MNKRRSLIWPVFLILLGSIFLLNNLNIITVDLWTILINFWPVLFIVAGIDLLFNNRKNVVSYVGILLVVGVVASVVWASNHFEGRVQFGNRISKSIYHEIGDVDLVEMIIDIPIGALKIASLDVDGVLIDGIISVGEFEDITDSLRIDNGVAFYRLKADGPSNPSTWNLGDNFSGDNLEWNLDIMQEIPLDLSISTGVSSSDINLTNMDITEFSFDGGVGETTITFPEDGEFRAYVDIGIGEVNIYLPHDLPVYIHTSIGIGDISVRGEYSQDGEGGYLSNNYDSDDGVIIYIDGGIGALNIIQSP